jgi:hypothetical protein
MVAEQEEGKTPPIISFKNVMTKQAYSNLNRVYKDMSVKFKGKLAELEELVAKTTEEEFRRLFFWENTNKQLFDDLINN